MKTIEQTKKHIEDCLDSMVLRPQMYAYDANSFELSYISLLDVLCFIEEKEFRHTYEQWAIFAYKQIGDENASCVAPYLKGLGKIDDNNWEYLINLLSKFRAHIITNAL